MNVQLAAGALLLIPLQGQNESNITVNGSKIDIVIGPHDEIQQPVANQPKRTEANLDKPAIEETASSPRKRSASLPLPCSVAFHRVKRIRSGLHKDCLGDQDPLTEVYPERKKHIPSKSQIHKAANDERMADTTASLQTVSAQIDIEHDSAPPASLHDFEPHVPSPAMSNFLLPCSSLATRGSGTPPTQRSSSVTDPETPSVHAIPSPMNSISPLSMPLSTGSLSFSESSPASTLSVRPANCETPSDGLPGAQIVSSPGASPLPFSSPLLQLQPHTLSPPSILAAATPSP
ncbi:hypothetical protein BC835DRAFT_1425192 [Cytidiella melzeri]|nr:hypothetical protein BC835DRAFT_1425192 [Cytidiella melzeri]